VTYGATGQAVLIVQLAGSAENGVNGVNRQNSVSCKLLKGWSGRRESNSQPTAWKAVTLPLSYSRSLNQELAVGVPSPNFSFKMIIPQCIVSGTAMIPFTMTPAGYMAKRVAPWPESMAPGRVVDIYSLSGCISATFCDYIKYWKHNGFWMFDSPEIIRELADENSIDLTGMRFFYYEVHELEFSDARQWVPLQPDESFQTQVVVPQTKTLEGYDVVTFSVGSSPECSPLSCNWLSSEIETNQHCLLTSLQEAQQLLEAGRFEHSEPGPYRIFAVYSV
jgi:hypothetical protein